ncbi:MAG TPA: hypothetical protein PLP19_00560 [bacterium]|nr:hypothetical protein [bacterium]HPN41955.1 hypothetical protein [bacterium]
METNNYLYYYCQQNANNFWAAIILNKVYTKEKKLVKRELKKISKIRSNYYKYDNTNSDMIINAGFLFNILQLFLNNLLIPFISISSITFLLFLPLHIINSNFENITDFSNEDTGFTITQEFIDNLELPQPIQPPAPLPNSDNIPPAAPFDLRLTPLFD